MTQKCSETNLVTTKNCDTKKVIFFCQTKNYKKLWKTKRDKKIGTKTCEKLNGDKNLWHLFAKQIIYLQNQYIKKKNQPQKMWQIFFKEKCAKIKMLKKIC